MSEKIFKPFFSKVKERKWLDSMGENGYLLQDINDSSYTFEINPGKRYYYCIENLSVSPYSDTADEYFASRISEGIKPVYSKGNWVYSVRENEPVEIPEKVRKSIAGIYGTRCIYLYFFALVLAFVCGFQFYAVNYLDAVGYVSKNIKLIEILPNENGAFFVGFKNFFKGIGNIFINLANGYFKLWTDVFGNSDAIKVVSVLLPVLVVLLIIAAFNLDEYLKYRKNKPIKNTENDSENNSYDIEISEEEENAEQKI